MKTVSLIQREISSQMPGVRYIIPLALAKSEGEQALYFKINTLPQAQMDTASAVPKYLYLIENNVLHVFHKCTEESFTNTQNKKRVYSKMHL